MPTVKPQFTDEMRAEISFERDRIRSEYDGYLPKLRPDFADEFWTRYTYWYLEAETRHYPTLYFLHPAPEDIDPWFEDLRHRALDYFTPIGSDYDVTTPINEGITRLRNALPDKIEEYYRQRTGELRLLNHLELARESLLSSPNAGITISQIKVDGAILKACREVLSEQARDKLIYFVKEKGLSREAFRVQIGTWEEDLIRQLREAWPKDLAERMRPFRSDFQFARYKESLQALAGPALVNCENTIRGVLADRAAKKQQSAPIEAQQIPTEEQSMQSDVKPQQRGRRPYRKADKSRMGDESLFGGVIPDPSNGLIWASTPLAQKFLGITTNHLRRLGRMEALVTKGEKGHRKYEVKSLIKYYKTSA
jgi:hypothetical protein